MKWDAIGFDWNQARAFLAVAEEGSLSAAARALGQTQPTIGRQITALELDLGVTLFERAGRSVTITDAGQRLRDHAAAMAEAATQFSLVATGQSQQIEGVVRITVSDLFAAYLLPRVLEKLRDLAPKVRVDVVATNDVSDLLHREADIAVRHVRPTAPDLISRRIHDASAEFFAATRYLNRRGRPKTVADLSSHDFVGFGPPEEMIGHLRPMGIDITPEHFKTGSTNGLVAWEYVKHGFGVMVMSSDVGRMSPDVEPLFDGTDAFRFPMWLVTHREVHTAKRIRLVFDLLADELPRLMT